MLDTESRHSTGLDQGPSRDPWLTMDYYLDTDTISLQEMLDVDIKSEIENVIGEHHDMGFNFTDWSPLELDDAPIDSQDDLNKWLNSTSLLNGNSNSSSSNFNLDLNVSDASSVMVNPNSVIPLLSARARSPKTLTNKRRFSFTDQTTDIKDEKVSVDDETELENDTETEQYENENSESEEDDESDEEEEKVAKQTIVLQGGQLKTIAPQITKSQPMSKVNGQVGSIRVQNVKVLSPSQAHQVRKQMYNNNVHVAPSATQLGVKREKDYDLSDYDEKPYPKPAYSYSCLIAMALKNSQTGSLPVSEIYNFMCEHFPYFKTAPNGWKNSVRHNLSLNKCFEKIEKPAGNGNQRKGCLWAINPAKVTKMDEEVQKWSRKDPLAIKKAMIYPDHLELLERGEMKYAGNGDLSAEDSESSSDEAVEESGATYDAPVHVAANSVTDSYDESSQDCDVDITEQAYDEIDIEDNKEALRMQLGIAKQAAEEDEEDDEDEEEEQNFDLGPGAKRQKLVGTLQANYVYQPVTTSRRKTPLLLRAGANGSFLKID